MPLFLLNKDKKKKKKKKKHHVNAMISVMKCPYTKTLLSLISKIPRGSETPYNIVSFSSGLQKLVSHMLLL